MTTMKKLLVIVAVLGFSTPSLFSQSSTPGPVLQALEHEMKRAFEVLKQKGDPSPYFISYSVRENSSFNIESSLGALRSSDRDLSRLLDVDVRVGEYPLDSTHQIRGQRGTNTGPNFTYPVLMPIDNDIDAIRSVIWLETDQKYKAAVERFIQGKANRAIKVDEEDTSADMSRESRETATLPLAAIDVNVPNWENKLKMYSALFKKYPEIYDGSVSLSSNANNDYLVNSEGSSIQHGNTSVRLSIYARTKADDGMELYRFEVVDDPTADRIGGIDLNGHYAFGDDGIPAQKVTVVDKGILKNFLMSRSPVAGFENSNGHGRKAPGYRTVGRQGNLIVQATNTVSDARLRAMLIDEAKKQGKTFGLFFEDISGGFTLTGRANPQSFQVTPIMVYRIYVDGRPDELVRGVDLIGTPLTSFSKIVAAGDKPEIFNGVCGAESGFVPVAAVSPAILTTQIEVQKKSKSSDRPPILPPPVGATGGR